MKKVFKIFGIALVVIVLLLGVVSIIGLSIPGEMHVERSTNISAAPEKVFPLIANMKNWTKWSPWHNIDPNMGISYFVPEMGVGSGYEWTSEHDKVGNGKMTVVGYEENKKLDTQMDFMENGTGSASFILSPTNEGTTLTWTMDSDMGQGGFPFNVIGPLFKNVFKGYIEADYDKGLAGIKAEAEKQ